MIPHYFDYHITNKSTNIHKEISDLLCTSIFIGLTNTYYFSYAIFASLHFTYKCLQAQKRHITTQKHL